MAILTVIFCTYGGFGCRHIFYRHNE